MLIMRSIKICLQECPKDAFLLAIVSTTLSVLPAVILLTYNILINAMEIYEAAIPLVMLYCLLHTLQSGLYNFYHHYYLNYRSLLRFEKKMKQRFFQICAELGYEDYLIPKSVNETRRALNASINIFRLYQIMVEIVSSVVGILLIGGIVCTIDKKMLLFLLLTIVSPVADQVYRIIQKRYLLYNNTQKQKEEESFFRLLTKPEYLKEIRILRGFSFFYEKWASVRREVAAEENRVETKILLLSTLFQMIRIGGMIGAYWTITAMFMDKQITLGEFSMMLLTFTQIKNLFEQFFSLCGDLSEFTVMVKPYFVFLDKLVARREKESRKKITATAESDVTADGRAFVDDAISADSKTSIGIELKNASYKYPNSDFYALRNITFSLQPGSFLSIVGENGSGKTTLMKILLGILTPTEGERKVNIEEDYRNTAYVPQDFHCYCINLKENVLFGMPMEDKILRQHFLELDLEDLEKKKDSLYGIEFGGMELSGGQKQRLSILRAVCKGGDLFLFDEPTSAIDPLQESAVYRRLLDLTKGKTTVMVSHRLALTKQSNLIIVLKDGGVAEMGTHTELMEKNGVYARMWKAQADLYLK